MYSSVLLRWIVLRGPTLTISGLHLALVLVISCCYTHRCASTFCDPVQRTCHTSVSLMTSSFSFLTVAVNYRHLPLFVVSTECHRSFTFTDGTDAVHSSPPAEKPGPAALRRAYMSFVWTPLFASSLVVVPHLECRSRVGCSLPAQRDAAGSHNFPLGCGA